MSVFTVVFDLDGVIYVGDRGVPGAGEVLHKLTAGGMQLLFVTNNSTKTASEVARHVETATGFPVDEGDVVTSAMAAAAYLDGRAATVLVLGEPGLEHTLVDSGLHITEIPADAAAVVVGLDRRLTYDRLRCAAEAVLRGADLVATNADATYPTPTGVWPGGGAILAALETATGVQATVCGKPHLPMRNLIRERVGPGSVWVIGDRPETDVALGIAEGWVTVLVTTGVTAAGARVPAALTPHHVLDSIAGLPSLLRSAEQ